MEGRRGGADGRAARHGPMSDLEKFDGMDLKEASQEAYKQPPKGPDMSSVVPWETIGKWMEKEHLDMHWACGVAAAFLVIAALLDLPGLGGPWWTWADQASSLWEDAGVGDPCAAGLTTRCEALRATRTLALLSLASTAKAAAWTIGAYNMLKECMFATALLCSLICTVFHLLAISNGLSAPAPTADAERGGFGYGCFVAAFCCCICGSLSLVATKLLLPKEAEVVDVSVDTSRPMSPPEKGAGRKHVQAMQIKVSSEGA